ncbi:MAG TPA: choice-of-anchor Q domain-containing protein, partial [Solirubrobacteraceae bacterium]
DATRPVIRQTTPYKAGFSAPMFALEANVTIRDLEIDQTATTVNNGAGALDANQGDVIERTILTGGLGGMYATPNAPGTIAMRNDLVIAGGGVAIQLENGTMSLDNVTAIARGSESGTGVALLSHSTFNKASTIEATNTIARGQRYDAEASIESSGSGSTIVFHYSDARTAFELAQGSPTKVEDTDHPTHGEPAFAAAGDYHEALGSPTIDAGKPDAASGSIDLDGFARTVGAGTDIGAYELQKPRHRSSCRCHPCRSWCPSCRRRLHSPGWHSPRLASGRRPRAPRFHGIAPRSERRSPIATPRRRPRRSRSRSPSPGFAAGAPASHPRMGIDPAITAGRAAAT